MVRPHLRMLRTINTLQALTLHLSHTEIWWGWIWRHCFNQVFSIPALWAVDPFQFSSLAVLGYLKSAQLCEKRNFYTKGQTGTVGSRDEAHIFMSSLSLISRHKWMIISDIISYQTFSMSEVIERMWRLFSYGE